MSPFRALFFVAKELTCYLLLGDGFVLFEENSVYPTIIFI